jgi:hypothetical protein
MNINMSDEKIMDIKISGDFFGGKDISDIEHILKNTPLSKLNEILSDINIEEYICGMKREVFISHILM